MSIIDWNLFFALIVIYKKKKLKNLNKIKFKLLVSYTLPILKIYFINGTYIFSFFIAIFFLSFVVLFL